MSVIGAIGARYDVLSVQELSQILPSSGASVHNPYYPEAAAMLRHACGTGSGCSVAGLTGAAACALVDAVHAAAGPSRNFSMAASARLPAGSSSQEQYMVLFDSARFTLVADALYPDSNSDFVRDPWAVHLRDVNGTEFVLLSIHTPPSDAAEEIAAMAGVLSWAAGLTANVLLVGDYNADGSYFSEGAAWNTALFGVAVAGGGVVGDNFSLVAADSLDTTVAASANAYDRAIITTAWHNASVAAGGGAAALAYPFDSTLNFTALWEEGCGSAAYINTQDCTAKSAGTSSTEEQNRVAALEVSDHFPLELALCLPGTSVGGSGSLATPSPSPSPSPSSTPGTPEPMPEPATSAGSVKTGGADACSVFTMITLVTALLLEETYWI